MPENCTEESKENPHTRAMIDLVFVMGIPVAILLAIVVDIVTRSITALVIFTTLVILTVLSIFYIRAYKKDWATSFNNAWQVWMGRLLIDDEKGS